MPPNQVLVNNSLNATFGAPNVSFEGGLGGTGEFVWEITFATDANANVDYHAWKSEFGLSFADGFHVTDVSMSPVGTNGPGAEYLITLAYLDPDDVTDPGTPPPPLIQ